VKGMSEVQPNDDVLGLPGLEHLLRGAAIAWVRWRLFPSVSVGSSLVQVTVAGALVFAVGLILGSS
jgi:hypothetical protein